MTIRFDIEPGIDPIHDRKLVYRSNEYSFDTVSLPGSGFTSVLLDDLNVEMDASYRVCGIWGLCPNTRWIEQALTPPHAQQGALVVVSDHSFERGVSVRLNGKGYLPVHVDSRTGWIQVKGDLSPAVAIEIFSGVIFELTADGQFCALWLKPVLGGSGL
jgi:hypothetical protein